MSVYIIIFKERWISEPTQADVRCQSEVRDLLAWKPVTVDEGLLERAWNLQDRYKLSFWDALIVAAAKAAACRYLLTEDLQADQDLEGVVVVDPFLRDPAALS
ncbi:MAG: hypothetical protein DMG69_24460 [Acidobacteria bacterium]|nr:MAG: hypothetical protein DMG69_24460 [Acidobacteriota bacterium]